MSGGLPIVNYYLLVRSMRDFTSEIVKQHDIDFFRCKRVISLVRKNNIITILFRFILYSQHKPHLLF
jgi:hypothetical protein